MRQTQKSWVRVGWADSLLFLFVPLQRARWGEYFGREFCVMRIPIAALICALDELLYSIDDAISFAQTNIVQAELNEKGNYGEQRHWPAMLFHFVILLFSTADTVSNSVMFGLCAGCSDVFFLRVLFRRGEHYSRAR